MSNKLRCTPQESLKLRQHHRPTLFNIKTLEHWAMKKDVLELRAAVSITRWLAGAFSNPMYFKTTLN